MVEPIPLLTQPAGWLPLVFAIIMALAMLAYVILDGYDLGVGILLQRAQSAADKDTMVASIGPFWDANETWLVLGVGVLLVAFPLAHGFMLGSLITGFHTDLGSRLFAVLIGFCLLAAYCLLGAGWLIMKAEGALQLCAVRWARASLGLTGLGSACLSLATPLVSTRIYDKWFGFPNLVLLLPIPLVTLALFAVIARSLRRLPVRLQQDNQYGDDQQMWKCNATHYYL